MHRPDMTETSPKKNEMPPKKPKSFILGTKSNMVPLTYFADPKGCAVYTYTDKPKVLVYTHSIENHL